jgi:tRNA(Ile)-lysidine synthase TilS/MesJ
MSFTLTKEQQMIQKMAREFSRKVLAETAAERDITKAFPAENLKKWVNSALWACLSLLNTGVKILIRSATRLRLPKSHTHVLQLR